jgi:MoxR-like ATPase
VAKQGDIRRTSDEDRATESAVLQHVLSLHPSPIALDDLIRELADGEDSFGARDAVERAVRDLAGCGLLHRNGSLVLASRAALRFDQLLGE